MKLIVGLGNPGTKYSQTFHNLGFMAAEAAAQKLGVRFKSKECRAETASLFLSGEKVVLARPQTFMNLSGESVRELLGRYKADVSDLLVIYDDFDLERGALRLRISGSAGTHNGMKSIVECLGTTEFKRLRIGIGRPPVPGISVADYVLSKIPPAAREEMFEAIMSAADCACEFARGADFERLMQKYNQTSAQ